MGDKKQSIYAFRDCDPDLMEQAYTALLAGGSAPPLSTSYRSRASLVGFCSKIFAHTLPPPVCVPEEFMLEHPGTPSHIKALA
ncbi:MAG: hypothetical protein NTV79_10420 [Candidatus Aureabacteria bacterium]|nr:hypothetical protein [Candidatus Auribacterota bacterium]